MAARSGAVPGVVAVKNGLPSLVDREKKGSDSLFFVGEGNGAFCYAAAFLRGKLFRFGPLIHGNLRYVKL